MSGNSNKSIADVIYRSMEKALERQYGVENKGPSEIKDIFPVKKYIRIKNDNPGLTAKRIEKEKSIGKTDGISKYDHIIRQAAKKYGLHPALIRSVIKAESSGNPLAVSKAGAKGLMQLADTTASDMGVTDVFNPGENIEGGVKYLRLMIDRFDDIKNALAAYNAGPETVKRYEGIPPYPETQRYVKTVLENTRVEKPYY
jgi:soluble lytic murein transglycosylase-like protein